MKLIQRYILREYRAPLIYCLLAFSVIFLVIDLFENLGRFIRFEVPPGEILRYYGLLMLPIMEYILPISLLLATLYTLAYLTRFNEITAMRASGISPRRIMMPFMLTGLAFVMLSWLCKETISPAALEHTSEYFGRLRANKQISNVHSNFAYYNPVDRLRWWIEHLDSEHPDQLENVVVKFENENDRPERELSAARAEWLDGSWWFHDRVIKTYEHSADFGTPGQVSPRPVEHRELRARPGDFALQISQWDFLNSLEMHTYLTRHPELPKKERARKKTHLHQRLAMPWACLIAVLFGIPAGARTGRQGALVGILLALGFFFGYYALQQIGVFMGIHRTIWPWAGAWLPNVVFLVAGLVMIIRMK
tara:strand:+ start:1200 stop:2291 length:1092 start_codon:yes stop_codon:yes gene_type:complete